MSKTQYNKSYKAVRIQILESAHAFQMLGVHAQSTNAEVDAARRKLVRETHPDVNGAPDAHKLTAMANQAHSELTTNRAAYIRSLHLKPCAACKGKGSVSKMRGFTHCITTVCLTCHGAGVA